MAEVEARLGQQRVLPAQEGVRKPLREAREWRIRDRVLRGQRDDVAGRPLEHRHVLGAIRHRGHDRHGGRAAADHDDALAVVVEVLGPELRMDDLPAEAVGALEVGRVGLRVVVVARAREEEAARELHRLARVGALGVNRPARLLARPLRADDTVPVADLVVDSVLGRGLVDVLADRGAVRDRLRLLPRAERVAEREHVGVRPDARVAEQVPRAAHGVARLEDGEALAGAPRAQMGARADAREPGAGDQDVVVLSGGFTHAVRSNHRITGVVTARHASGSSRCRIASW